MLILNYNEEILNELHRIHDGTFPFPNFSDPTFIQKKILVDKGRIIGCGLVKITTEGVVILDQDSPIKSRVLGLQELQRNIVCELLKRGIHDIHAFIDDSKVIEFAKRLGWETCNSKPAMSLRF